MSAERNYRWAWALLDACAAAGVRRAVISPGSRSTPLTLAALRHPALTVQVCIDERAAAFFALGLVQAEGAPVALIATSGSAIGHWWPAVLEADRSGLPLLLLSADRPPELQDCGANQTTDQIKLFGAHVRDFRQLPPAEDDARWLRAFVARGLARCRHPAPGPVHWNIPLREPLTPDPVPELETGAPLPAFLPARQRPGEEAIARVQEIIGSGAGAIVCGPQRLSVQAQTAVLELAARLRAPIFADALSGLRCADAARGLVDRASLLHHPDAVAAQAGAPAWLLRIGGLPVSRAQNAWLARCRDSRQVLVQECTERADPSGQAQLVVQAEIAALCRGLATDAQAGDLLGALAALDARARIKADALCADPRPFEGSVLRALWRGLPAATPLFLGNSLTLRAANAFAGLAPGALRAFGNRGLSGIDGNLATACGIVSALGPGVAVLGDLAFLHDLNALALARALPLAIVLLDNGGGGIFTHLPQAALAEFERAWLAPQAFSAPALAEAFALDYVQAHTAAEALAEARATLDGARARIVHVKIQREHSLAQFQRMQEDTDS